MGGIIGILAAGIYVTFFSTPAHKKLVADLQFATTNAVMASLGQPYRIVEGTNFEARANEMAHEGYPITLADISTRGMVWLYEDGKIRNTTAHKYQAVFFNESNQVLRIEGTCWMKDPWGPKS